jgi:hypothetical protein
MRNILFVFFGFFLTIQNSSAQVVCNYSLGVLYPSNTWQAHIQLLDKWYVIPLILAE